MPEIVEQLDRLHEHLNNGGTLSNFMDGEITSAAALKSPTPNPSEEGKSKVF